MALQAPDRQTLLRTAADSIAHGLRTGKPLNVNPQAHSPELQLIRATFVTLEIQHRLRGCIGTLQASRPLIEDVAIHAFAAAFQDPRFPQVGLGEFPQLSYHISILSPSEPVQFSSQQDLLAKIRPGIDGIILSEGARRATFLPSVWDQLPDPVQFLAHLKQKAGLPPGYWSDTIRVERYTADNIG